MADIIRWNILKNYGDEKLQFERFCFHIAEHLFGRYGSLSYFYNTPGSEFYLTVNKQFDHEGKIYYPGDVIGWQAKFWKGEKDDNNSPLTSDHRKELVEGFKKTRIYRPEIKLWIICTPGSFVQKYWDLLTEELSKIDLDCSFDSWHKDIFEGFYLKHFESVNGVFKYYFGEWFLDKDVLINISKDTLCVLNNKFDVDLHTPSDFEKTLLGIVDNNSAFNKLGDIIMAAKRQVDKERKNDLLSESHWGYKLLTDSFKDLFTLDCRSRYDLIDQACDIYQKEGVLWKERVSRIANAISNYKANRRDRVDALNKEIKVIYSKHNVEHRNLNYFLNEMIININSLEKKITGGEGSEEDNISSVVNLIRQKDFSVFAQAGYGKTHLACSLAGNMVKRNLPVLFLTGGTFRKNDSYESIIRSKLELSESFSFNDVLDILDFIGETNGCKLPIIIDGLNESAPNESRWREDLPILRRKIKKRNNLLLITTCREKEEYIEIIYGAKEYKSVDNHIVLKGLLDTNLDVVVKKYFAKYGICNATITHITDFENPLLLKMFCLTNQGRNNLLVNEYSIASCMKVYSEQLLDSIATNDGHLDKFLRYKLEKGLDSVACLIWESNNRAIDYYEQFFPLFGNQAEGFLKEGMCFTLDNNHGEEQILFTYDMVAGYQIAKYLLKNCDDIESFKSFVNNNSKKLFGDKRHTLAEDINKCLTYLLPIRFNQEWIEIMPTDDVIKASLDNLEIILATNKGKQALIDVLSNHEISDALLETIVKLLHERFVVQKCIGCVSLFIEFFTRLENIKIDMLWNRHCAGYSELQEAYSVIHDKFNSNKYSIEDNLTYSLLMCGITDKEFRQKFYWESVSYALKDCTNAIEICHRMLAIHDPFIREIIFSIIACIGLRNDDLTIVNRCIRVLEEHLKKTHSTNVVLLDDLETLYSYAEIIGDIEYDRTKLYLNFDNKWPVGNAEAMRYSSFYSYDFDKFNIRPLYIPDYESSCEYTEEEIYGMLYSKIEELGYDKGVYMKLENQEYEKTKYRWNLKVSYSFKYGREALMELYGWFLLHGKLQNEYQGTFRTQMIDIDPSSPLFSVRKSLIADYLLPLDLSMLTEWMTETLTDRIKGLSVCRLPDRPGKWVLLRCYCTQKDTNVYSQLYFSLTSQLVSRETDKETLKNIHLDDETYHSHAFAVELGWRELLFTEEYNDDEERNRLLARYSFSDWSQERFRYRSFSCLSPSITRKVGLSFDLNKMSYVKGNEEVSAYYINDTDLFFYLRKDVVDELLDRLDAKIRHHIYEFRMVEENLPPNAPTIKERFVQHDDDCFYDNRT